MNATPLNHSGHSTPHRSSGVKRRSDVVFKSYSTPLRPPLGAERSNYSSAGWSETRSFTRGKPWPLKHR